ncbi:MAG: hypothetical protein M1132_04845 [Chloroflexi bacterium]|nr:hypothetical protein [Chloroflexota bacterium]
MDTSSQLTKITLGIDHLYRAQSSGTGELDREGLVNTAVADFKPARLENWDDAEAHLRQLALEKSAIDDAQRRAYVAEMIESLLGLVATFRGDRQSYAERVRNCLRVNADPSPQDVLDSYGEEIDRQLGAMGYRHGNLSERVMKWESDNQVPPEQVPAVLGELLHTARQRTQDKVLPVPDEMVKPIGVRNVAYAAYCGYAERKLRVNLDYVHTRSGLKHLACHEAFPGHWTHLAIREQRVKAGEMPPDAALVVTNSASSPIFEGIGENGISFLDWIEGPADSLTLALNRLRSAGRMNAALMIHVEGRPLEQAKQYLLQTCFVTRAWVDSRVAFLTHRLRAPFIFAYWQGDRAVQEVWEQLPSHRRPEFFQYVYHRMHSATTLGAFWPTDSPAPPVA